MHYLSEFLSEAFSKSAIVCELSFANGVTFKVKSLRPYSHLQVNVNYFSF